MIKIKKTKSVLMHYDEELKLVYLNMPRDYAHIDDEYIVLAIPMSKIFQVQRGLTSAIQRFYRKKVKHGR